MLNIWQLSSHHSVSTCHCWNIAFVCVCAFCQMCKLCGRRPHFCVWFFCAQHLAWYLPYGSHLDNDCWMRVGITVPVLSLTSRLTFGKFFTLSKLQFSDILHVDRDTTAYINLVVFSYIKCLGLCLTHDISSVKVNDTFISGIHSWLSHSAPGCFSEFVFVAVPLIWNVTHLFIQ